MKTFYILSVFFFLFSFYFLSWEYEIIPAIIAGCCGFIFMLMGDIKANDDRTKRLIDKYKSL